MVNITVVTLEYFLHFFMNGFQDQNKLIIII